MRAWCPVSCLKYAVSMPSAAALTWKRRAAESQTSIRQGCAAMTKSGVQCCRAILAPVVVSAVNVHECRPTSHLSSEEVGWP